MPSLLIKNGRIIDPAESIDVTGDILVLDGVIHSVGIVDSTIKPDKIIDASNLCVFPGLIDVHVHFRDPGFTHKEDFKSGSSAALAGGFTSAIQMPNTNPPLSTAELVSEYTRNEPVRSYVAAAVTSDRAGKQINDLETLYNAGAAAFSDDGSPVHDDSIMADALIKSKQLGLRIMSHAENLELVKGGAIVKGEVADELGLAGIERDAESSMVERDIQLAAKTQGLLHICHVSIKKSVELIRKAKSDGVNITAEVTPHHLLLNHKAVLKYGSNAKMNPPLAYEEDRLACVDGLKDGTLDIIATDHAPHSKEEKSQSVSDAPFGIIGLETSFALMYTHFVKTGELTLMQLIERMSLLPSRIFNLPGGSITAGNPADLTIVDLNGEYTIDAGKFHSKSANTPFGNWNVQGRVKWTIVDGEIRFAF
jgi:dihydroorotase